MCVCAEPTYARVNFRASEKGNTDNSLCTSLAPQVFVYVKTLPRKFGSILVPFLKYLWHICYIYAVWTVLRRIKEENKVKILLFAQWNS